MHPLASNANSHAKFIQISEVPSGLHCANPTPRSPSKSRACAQVTIDWQSKVAAVLGVAFRAATTSVCERHHPRSTMDSELFDQCRASPMRAVGANHPTNLRIDSVHAKSPSHCRISIKADY